MKITFQAFKWDCQSPTFRMQDFLRESSNRNGSLSRSRVSYFFEDGDYWVGLILTIKNMRKFVTLKQAQEAITLDVHVLDDNERIADFNFFVFNPTKGY